MKKQMHTLAEWQALLDEYRRDPNHEHSSRSPAAMRIDGTQFSTARFYGGFTYNNKHYRVEYYDDALLGIREDFEKWAKEKDKKAKKAKEASRRGWFSNCNRWQDASV